MSKITDETNQYVFSLFDDYATYPIDDLHNSEPCEHHEWKIWIFLCRKTDTWTVLELYIAVYHHPNLVYLLLPGSRILEFSYPTTHTVLVSHFLDDDDDDDDDDAVIPPAGLIIFRVCVCVCVLTTIHQKKTWWEKGRFLVLLEWVSEEFSPF